MKCPFCNKSDYKVIEEYFKEQALRPTYKSGELNYCYNCDKVFEVIFDKHGWIIKEENIAG